MEKHIEKRPSFFIRYSHVILFWIFVRLCKLSFNDVGMIYQDVQDGISYLNLHYLEVHPLQDHLRITAIYINLRAFNILVQVI